MNLTRRNNSGSFAPFSMRLPRFEYQAIPFAETTTRANSPCGEDYPFDRRERLSIERALYEEDFGGSAGLPSGWSQSGFTIFPTGWTVFNGFQGSIGGNSAFADRGTGFINGSIFWNSIGKRVSSTIEGRFVRRESTPQGVTGQHGFELTGRLLPESSSRGYSLRLWENANGDLAFELLKRTGDTSFTTLESIDLSGSDIEIGQYYWLRFELGGTNLRGRYWKESDGDTGVNSIDIIDSSDPYMEPGFNGANAWQPNLTPRYISMLDFYRVEPI